MQKRSRTNRSSVSVRLTKTARTKAMKGSRDGPGRTRVPSRVPQPPRRQIIFRHLTKEDLKGVIDLNCRRYVSVWPIAFGVILTDASKEFLIKNGSNLDTVHVHCVARFEQTHRRSAGRRNSARRLRRHESPSWSMPSRTRTARRFAWASAVKCGPQPKSQPSKRAAVVMKLTKN